MKKRILLTAILLPSLIFTSPANATDIVVPAGVYSNQTGVKGAVYNVVVGDSLTVGANTVFSGNIAEFGGAIYTAAKTNINGATFENNVATTDWGGGAIKVNVTSDVVNNLVTIENSTFTGNRAEAQFADSSAISIQAGNVNIDNSTFTENIGYGGAIYAYKASGIVNISNSVFDSNEGKWIGAIGNFSRNGVMTISNTVFSNNKAILSTEDGGGALFLGSESKTVIKDSLFENNYSAGVGGAIATRDNIRGDNTAAKLDIVNTSFVNNEAAGNGGAIYNAFYNSTTNPQNISVKGVVFEGNKSGGNGGAIYNEAADRAGVVSTVYVTDSSFINNSATDQGGAIFANGTVNVKAYASDVIFANNTASDGGDIYMATAGSNLNIVANEGTKVGFASGISGVAYNMNINTSGAGTGSVVFNSAIQNATIAVQGGELHLAEGSSLVDSSVNMASGTTLNTINGAVDNYVNDVTLANDVTLLVDVNMGDGSTDNFDFENVTSVTIEEVNPIGNTTENTINANIADLLGIDTTRVNVTIADALQQETQTIMTPIRTLTGSVDAQGNMSFVPTGNGYKDFNPAVMTSSVAAQLGGLFTQYNSYNQAFMNMDMRMQMNRQEREALRLRNSIASADANAPIVYSPIFQPDKNKGAWMRGYSTFESVNMDGGPKVNNVMYGTFFGGDSDMQELENGGEIQYSVYAGYNGSHQTYSGNSMWQNGGTMGVTGAYYKENFFTALTANVGASVVDASTIFGKEDFPMLMAGIASKTGYNIELADGKFIIQPNYLMSYSFVNTFDYTNAAGVRIKSDPLNSIQIAPGVKFIGNLKNGWQPYASVRMVWNVMDKTDFTAANTSLPELSIKPWVEYGVGVQKRWGERFTGFAQTMLRSGGRNGVSLGLGFRWAIGKAPEKNPNARNYTPELPKTKVTLNR